VNNLLFVKCFKIIKLKFLTFELVEPAFFRAFGFLLIGWAVRVALFTEFIFAKSVAGRTPTGFPKGHWNFLLSKRRAEGIDQGLIILIECSTDLITRLQGQTLRVEWIMDILARRQGPTVLFEWTLAIIFRLTITGLSSLIIKIAIPSKLVIQ
jgi:hypothetical protein